MRINKIPLVFLLISTALTIYWFSSRTILGTGEEGIPFYNPQRTYDIYRSVWKDIEVGVADPFTLPTVPVYAVASYLYQIGISNWFLQALLYFLLLNTALMASYKLGEIFFPKMEKIYLFSVSLFYLFNLYTMTQVFQRFLYPLMFQWAYLPLFLFLWINTLLKLLHKKYHLLEYRA